MSRQVIVDAPAKVNLALAVGSPDAQGMHPICSWMVTVDLCDELLLTRLPADRFSRYAILWHDEARRRSEIDWPITQDLAVRAHLALEQRLGRRLPVQLKLDKRVPVGGGLGGGSSNAAAMLVGLRQLYDLDLSDDDLAEVGATLGSDVPFLVRGGSAIVSGLGERLEPHEAPPELDLVLVLPEAACPTGAVYAQFDRSRGEGGVSADAGPATADGGPDADAVRRLAGDGRTPPAADACFNDLAPAARRLEPTLERIAAEAGALAERPAHVSGSGSSLFIVCDDPLHAEHLARALDERGLGPAVAVRARPGPSPADVDPDAEASAPADPTAGPAAAAASPSSPHASPPTSPPTSPRSSPPTAHPEPTDDP